jgi:hypothetical protein
MGLAMLKEENCNYPGLGEFYNPAIDQPPPVEPAPLGAPPPEPAIPERPVQPADQSDTVAMADFFTKIQEWEIQATAIQEDYKLQIEDYQAKSELYKSEIVAYQEELIKWQIAQASAVTPAEGIMDTFYTGIGWSFVDKENVPAYWAKIMVTWLVQLFIVTLLFVAIIYLQKRKDVT